MMTEQYYQNPNENINIYLEKKFDRICLDLAVIFKRWDSFDLETGMSGIGNYRGQDEIGKTSWFQRMLFIFFAYPDDKLTETENFVNQIFQQALVKASNAYVKNLHREEWLDNALKSGGTVAVQAYMELMDVTFVVEQIVRYYAAIMKTVINDDLKNKTYEQIRAIFSDEVSPVFMLALSRRYDLNANEVSSLLGFYGKTKEKKAETLDLINNKFFGMDSESKSIKKVFHKIKTCDKKIV